MPESMKLEIKMKWQISTIAILLSVNVHAQDYTFNSTSQDQPWSVTASIGSGKYEHGYYKNDSSALARLALGNEMMLSGDIILGLELGVQNTNYVYLQIPYETLAVLKWIPVQTALGPMLDLLVTVKSDPLGESSFFAQLKGGIAYRNWQIQQKSIDELSQLAGEIQAGFGYPITTLANLNLSYQGVFGGDPNVQWNTYSKKGHVSSIPSLHGILLGFSVNL